MRETAGMRETVRGLKETHLLKFGNRSSEPGYDPFRIASFSRSSRCSVRIRPRFGLALSCMLSSRVMFLEEDKNLLKLTLRIQEVVLPNENCQITQLALPFHHEFHEHEWSYNQTVFVTK